MASNSTGSRVGGMASGEEIGIPFPFEPYEVQKQLIHKIYNIIERKGVGIFESPTGTVRGHRLGAECDGCSAKQAT